MGGFCATCFKNQEQINLSESRRTAPRRRSLHSVPEDDSIYLSPDEKYFTNSDNRRKLNKRLFIKPLPNLDAILPREVICSPNQKALGD